MKFKVGREQNSELMDNQVHIIRFVKMLASVLRVDAEVVDANLTRIAGTGPFNKDFGKRLENNQRLNRYVLETHQDKVVVKPREDPICLECTSRDSCQETAFIGVPILMEDRCLGVISLVAFDCVQQQRMQDNITMFTDYVRHIAQVFVSRLVADENQFDALENVITSLIDNMDQGVLVLNSHGEVLNGNEKALNHLCLSTEQLRSNVIDIKPVSMHNIGHQQHIITIGNRQELLIGQFHQYDSYQLFLMSFYQPNGVVTEQKQKPGLLRNVIGDSKKMEAIKRLVVRIADSPSSVLINGESGTGKEVIANAVHQASNRKDKPFIAINCAAIPETLLESELFGYVKGAFTGASSKGKTGLIRAADKGTLFLDEIGDMPMTLQAKLLRVLEAREVMPIGASKPIPVSIRVISATNQDFHKMIEAGTFRQDLYYRLNVIPMFLPPLKEREGDINQLFYNFLERHAQRVGISYPGVSEQVLAALNHYEWPGNVRELSNLVEYLVNVVAEGEEIDTDLLPPYISVPENITLAQPLTTAPKGLSQRLVPADDDSSIEDMEIKLIQSTLKRVKNRKEAAKELGIGIATLYRKIKKYQLGSVEY